MKNKKKYFLYARKSTDTEDKQVQSLQDQVEIMQSKVDLYNIEIVEVFSESMSAKKPWRYRFNEMVERINKWEASGIISWKLDRLTRNPIDTGTIQFMLQNGQVESIITNDREYNPVDAWLLFSVETGMSNQFLLDLKKNVKRWMDSKVEKWIFPWQAPEWYKNNRLKKIIEVDDNNFSLVRKMWDMLLSWNYTVSQIMDIANNKWAYKRSKIRRNAPDDLSLSGMYKLFQNPFYTGRFMWNGELRQWVHQPMITMKEYERVQEILGRKWASIRPKTKDFSYTGMIQCWECWWMITATEKTKKIRTTGEIKTYIYYHCSKRKKWISCNQKPIKLELLEKQINEVLGKIEILPEFKQWWLDILKRDYHEQLEHKKKVQTSIRKSISNNENKLHKLTDLLLDELIDKDEYNIRKESLKVELFSLNDQLKSISKDKDEATDITEELFDVIVNVTDKFNKWTLKDKKRIFSILGENFVLKDWKMAIQLYPWIQPIENKLSNIKQRYAGLEPYKKGISFNKTDTLNGVILLWYSQGELNPCFRRERAAS